jgi:phage shock protein PspC (stress-responsive transcriptional regulator)
MKKTISINLAGLVYQIDDDAFKLLEAYLEKLKLTFTDVEEQKEILGDIEHRFAELFSEKLGKRTEVVNKKMVEEAIETLGDIDLIEEETNGAAGASTNKGTRGARKLFRSKDDKVLGGVLGGLGVYFGIESIWLRLIFVLLAIASVGVPIGMIYLILWLVMPKAETASQKLQMQGETVNLSTLQENLKKNLSGEGLSQTGSRIVAGFGEIFKLSAKTVALIIGAVIAFKLLVLSFVWFFATFFVNFIGPEYLGLIFDHNWQFLILSTCGFLLIAIPFILTVYLLFKVVYRQNIPWGKSLIISAALWLFALMIGLLLVFTVAKNYKVESVAQNYMDLPFNDSLQELKVNFINELEDEDFKFLYKKGNFKSGGFEYNNSDLKFNSVFLQIEPSETGERSLYISKSSRGKDKETADKHLEKFSYNVSLENGNELNLPVTLNLIDEHKFRVQQMTYTLAIPIGTSLVLGDNARDYIDEVAIKSDYKKKQLNNNTWLMTSSGLECLTCLEELKDVDAEKDLEQILEEHIENEIKDALKSE